MKAAHDQKILFAYRNFYTPLIFIFLKNNSMNTNPIFFSSPLQFFQQPNHPNITIFFPAINYLQ